MEHYKVVIEYGKKKSLSRVMFVRAHDIVEAMGIGYKVKGGKPISVKPVTFKEYMKGVDKKYDEPKNTWV